VRALTAAVEAIETATDDRVGAAELEFDRALADASGNRPLARVAAALADAMEAAAPPRHGHPEAYRRVLDAIAAADPAAARAAMRLAVSIRGVGDVRRRGEGPDRAAS
jgi:DNA-binding FadR family transcriptional regulator